MPNLVGDAAKCFLEAKRPSVSIKDDLAPAYPLRRYAWTGKPPLSILTDFEEFAAGQECQRDSTEASKLPATVIVDSMPLSG